MNTSPSTGTPPGRWSPPPQCCHITQEDQERRFQHRNSIEYQRWQLTEEDWRTRGKWAEYEQAVNDMVEHTSTHLAPWSLIPANDENYARVAVIKVLCKRLEEALDG